MFEKVNVATLTVFSAKTSEIPVRPLMRIKPN